MLEKQQFSKLTLYHRPIPKKSDITFFRKEDKIKTKSSHDNSLQNQSTFPLDSSASKRYSDASLGTNHDTISRQRLFLSFNNLASK